MIGLERALLLVAVSVLLTLLLPGSRSNVHAIDRFKVTAAGMEYSAIPARDSRRVKRLELEFDDALKVIKTAEIQAGKTIMLLWYVKLKGSID